MTSRLSRGTWSQGGQEPDPRFTMANERTFLAWLRTSLAFLAAAVALEAVQLPWPDAVRTSLAVLLVLIATGCALHAWLSWARTQRALRHGEPLPGPRASRTVVAALVLVGLVVLVAVLTGA